ncbi:DEAD/DEAH box helicase family protein [Streptomyces sp. NPDC053069]|uniref:DEAD/DEAH box helicase family protein n=1 Tax=Streptomyces sp. NPDC053069 TaxID=3365695 RepID=UPI0037D186A4
MFVSATGTGKTLVSIRVADGLGVRLVLFVVPTLDLAAQSALAWRRDGHGEHMVIVSSMDVAGRDELVAARIMSTTSPHALGGLMSAVGERRGSDSAVDGDLHLRLHEQDRGNSEDGVRGPAVRPCGHG